MPGHQSDHSGSSSVLVLASLSQLWTCCLHPALGDIESVACSCLEGSVCIVKIGKHSRSELLFPGKPVTFINSPLIGLCRGHNPISAPTDVRGDAEANPHRPAQNWVWISK